ncbi:MAG TPA: DNA gyrase inhibitor YacG [Sphingomicrobium sp.]|nr:DNA gyrase inhibitor YacG [Sphingomicrobium sp.]
MRSGAACPLCGRNPEPRHRPFCSRGCRDRDLLNWLGDAYRVPAGPADEAMENPGNGLDIQQKPSL